MKRLYYFVTVCILAMSPAFVSAHAFDFAVMHSEMKVDGKSIYFESIVGEAINPTQENDTFQFVQNYVRESLLVRSEGSACDFSLSSFTVDQSTNQAKIVGNFICPQEIQVRSLQIQSNLYRSIFEYFEHHMSIGAGAEKYHMLFNQDQTLITQIVDEQREKVYMYQAVVPFFGIGVEHIVFGTDHLLFLLMIVLLMSRFRHIFTAITVFTVAHSVTLIASMFGWIQVSSDIVEPMIALTIIYSAVFNLIYIRSKKQPKKVNELALVGLFGLIHGLGFAASMHGILLPEDFMAYAIALFNIGIEVGQLAILAVVLPILWYVRKTKYGPYILKFISILVLLIAVYWFIERIL